MEAMEAWRTNGPVQPVSARKRSRKSAAANAIDAALAHDSLAVGSTEVPALRSFAGC